MNLDLDYLGEIAPTIDRQEVRWGCSHDGQRLGLVGHVIRPNGRMFPPRVKPSLQNHDESPVLFYAGLFPGCSITRAVRMFDEIALAMNLPGLQLVMRGELGRSSVFIRHLRQEAPRHKVKLFMEGIGRSYAEEEVVAAVSDDRYEGLITLAAEFEKRPERILLDEEIGLVDLGKKLTVLQEAYVYGMGQWACKERRAKYTVGSTNFAVW